MRPHRALWLAASAVATIGTAVGVLTGKFSAPEWRDAAKKKLSGETISQERSPALRGTRPHVPLDSQWAPATSLKQYLPAGETPARIYKELALASGPEGEGIREAFLEVYAGRWIPEPGWTAVVTGLPRRLPSGEWAVPLELDKVRLLLCTTDDASQLRTDYYIRIGGRVADIYYELNTVSSSRYNRFSWLEVWIADGIVLEAQPGG